MAAMVGKYDGWGVGGQWPATLVYSEYLSSRWRHWWQPHVATTSGQNVEFHTAHQHQRIFKLSIWRHFRMILADLCSPLLRTNICFFRCHNFTHYSFSTGIQILLLQNRQWWTDSVMVSIFKYILASPMSFFTQCLLRCGADPLQPLLH